MAKASQLNEDSRKELRQRDAIQTAESRLNSEKEEREKKLGPVVSSCLHGLIRMKAKGSKSSHIHGGYTGMHG